MAGDQAQQSDGTADALRPGRLQLTLGTAVFGTIHIVDPFPRYLPLTSPRLRGNRQLEK